MMNRQNNKNNKNIRQKATVAFFSLFVRRVLLQAIFTISNIFLARLLFPEDFGIFAIVGSVGSIFTVFSDIGLTPSLVQKKEEPTDRDIKSAFTVQLLLGIFIVMVIYLISDKLASFYGLGSLGINLLKLYSLTFLILPFKQIPVAILERNLIYSKLVVIEVVSIFIGSSVTVLLAILGFGVYSFAYGLLINYLSAALLYNTFTRWSIGLLFIQQNLLRLIRFGIPYQTNLILGLFYGPLILLYLGKIVGPQNLGFYQFATSISVFPLAFSEIISRISFPIGSRLQTNKNLLKKLVERVISTISISTLPLIAVSIVAIKPFLLYVYTDRWLPALPAIYLGLLQMGIISYTGVFSQLLLARGDVKIVRNVSIFWVLLTWVLAPFLIHKFNFVGMSLASLFVSASGIIFYFKLKRYVKFSFWGNILIYMVGSIFSAGVFVACQIIFPGMLVSVIISTFIAFLSYFLFLYLFKIEAISQYFLLVRTVINSYRQG